MAKTLKQSVLQISIENVDERIIISYDDDGTSKSTIILKSELEGDDLTAYNAFIQLLNDQIA